MARPNALPWVASLLALAACDLTLPWAKSEVPGAHGSLTAEPGRLDFAGRVGDGPPPAQTLRVANRTGYAVGVEYDVALLSVSVAGPDAVSVAAVFPDEAGPGSHATELRLWPCQPGPVSCTPVAGAVPLVIPVTYTVSPSLLAIAPGSLALDYVDSVSEPPSGTVTVDDPGGSGAWSAELLPSGACATANLFLPTSTGTALPASIVVRAYVFAMSAEESCTRELRVTKGRATASAQVTFTARFARFTAAPASVDLAGVAYQLPLGAPLVVTLTSDAGPAPFWTQLSATDWLEVRQTASAPVQLTFRPTRSDLSPGTYSATLEVRASNWAAPATAIPVTYTLAGRALRVVPFRWAPVVSGATLPADLVQAVQLQDAGTPLAWTAAASAPWLQATPASGTTGPGAQLELSVAIPALEAAGQGVNEAEVAITYGLPGGGTERVAVSVGLDMWLPHLERVLPRAVAAGQESRAASYGRDGPAGFTVGGVEPVYLGWSGRLTFLKIPALAAGSYALPVPNKLGLSRSRASLQVLDPVTRSAAAVAAPGRKTRLLLDDAAGILYAPNPGQGTLDRYRAAAGWARETLTLAGLRDAALAPDGASLAAVAGAEVKVVDAAAFALAAAQPAAPVIPETGAAGMDWRIAYGIDGAALVLRADAEAGVYAFDGAGVAPVFASPRGWGEPAASGDGGSVWIARGGATALPVTLYQPASQSFWTPGPNAFSAGHAAPDRGGVFVLFVRDGAASGSSDSMLLDTRFMAPASGKLPATVASALLTADGTRAVAWDPPAGKVRIFDLGGALSAGRFPEVGSGVAPAADPGAGAAMVLSADERTLFLAGDQRLVVVPLP